MGHVIKTQNANLKFLQQQMDQPSMVDESVHHEVCDNNLNDGDTATEDMSMSMRQDYNQRSNLKSNNENSQGTMMYSPRSKKNGLMAPPKLNRIQ
jgi:hypothetical protein